jgi:hypothetical protein
MASSPRANLAREAWEADRVPDGRVEVGLQVLPLPGPATHRFWLLSAPRAHTEAPYKPDVLCTVENAKER